MDQAIIFFFAAILIIGGLLFIIIAVTKKDPKILDVDKYRTKWLAIETQLKRDEMSSHSLTILNADKLLDQALIEKSLSGNTMAERMKQVQGKWSHADSVWAAHKLRNRIAHEADVTVDYDTARRALASFKQALKDIGAI